MQRTWREHDTRANVTDRDGDLIQLPFRSKIPQKPDTPRGDAEEMHKFSLDRAIAQTHRQMLQDMHWAKRTRAGPAQPERACCDKKKRTGDVMATHCTGASFRLAYVDV